MHKFTMSGWRRRWSPVCLFVGLIWAGNLVCATGEVLQAAEPQYPIAIAAGKEGALFVADLRLPGVWQVTAGKRSLYFEGAKKFRTPLNAVRCVLVDKDGQLLAGDSSTREVYRFNADKQPVPLTKGEIGIPMALAQDKAGNLYIADLETHRIFKLAVGAEKPEEFAVVPAPRGLTIDDEDRLWVVSHGDNQLLRLSADGKGMPEVIVAGRPFEFPNHIVLDTAKNAYIADGYAKTIWKVGADQKPVKYASGAPLDNPVGLAWQGETLVVVDPRAKGFLFAVDAAGKITPLPWE